MKILIADKFGPGLEERLARFGTVRTADDAFLAEAEVVLVRSATKVNHDYIDRVKKLRLVIRGGVGIDNIDAAYCKEKGILVRNTPAASSIAVAELALALMLALVRRVPEAHASMRAGGWEKKSLKGSELGGKTLGLVGAGRIAREVALRAKAFGMRVVACRRSKRACRFAKLVPFERLLAEADFVSLHLPLTDDTKHLVGAETLARMKKGAFLVNTARGALVDEAALAEALRSGKLGGAGVDVYAPEPPDPKSPLLSAPNVVLTPHLGSSTAENMERIADEAVALIEAFEAGKLK